VDRVVFSTATATFSCAVSISGTVSVPAKSFAISKIADGTANRLYGTDGSGVATEVTLGTGLSLSSSSLSATSALPRGYIDGLILSNGTDATNDINIAAGKCRDSTDAVDIVIATALGKQLDADWAVGGTTGTSLGMRCNDAGIANGTYHLYAVRTAASSAGDVYAYPGVAGTSATASATISTMITALQGETGGGSYAYARYLGSIVRAGATILAFTQYNDDFYLSVPVLDTDLSNPGTSAVSETLNSLPLGVKVKAFCNIGTGSGSVYISSLDTTDAAASSTVAPLATVGPSTHGQIEVFTNTSAQIRLRMTADVSIKIASLGWRDRRGKDA
jgi:hypothetical protein